jgi:two-component system, NarL family, captular synthesis response regulator RcsB
VNTKVRVAIADDHPFVIFGVHKALRCDSIEVVGTAGNASELLALLDEYPCDVVLTDYSMPHAQSPDGWEFLAALSSSHPQLPFVVYSEFDDPFLIGSLVQRGSAGLVSKRDEVSELRSAIMQVAAGAQYLSPYARLALDAFWATPELRRFSDLTRRQMEIAGLMLCGLSVGETAKMLRRSPTTISMQRREACRRLGFDAECEVFRFAANHDLWLERPVAASES